MLLVLSVILRRLLKLVTVPVMYLNWTGRFFTAAHGNYNQATSTGLNQNKNLSCRVQQMEVEAMVTVLIRATHAVAKPSRHSSPELEPVA